MTELDLSGMDLQSPELTRTKISKRDLQLLDFSTLQERSDYKEQVGYSPVLFSQVCLPYKDPKNLDVWERRNGDVILKVTPDVVKNELTGVTERRYTFGIMPRLLVAYLTTEATRTGSRDIDLGRSLTEFMRSLGIAHTGVNARRLRDHMDRFFRASITFDGNARDRPGRTTVFFKFADQMTLSVDGDLTAQPSDISRYRKDWESEVKLSEAFFGEIVSRSVPLDLNALRQLGSSPLRLDIYLWLCHKMSFVNKDTYVKWETLSDQFGSQYKEPRQFKAAFVEALAAVAKVYPGLNIEEGKGCIILKPSRTPIARIPGKAGVKFQGDQRAIGV